MLTVSGESEDTFCGTWYLPHSQVHNERTVPIIMAGCIKHVHFIVHRFIRVSFISTVALLNCSLFAILNDYVNLCPLAAV